jgi:hypothetical protein
MPAYSIKGQFRKKRLNTFISGITGGTLALFAVGLRCGSVAKIPSSVVIASVLLGYDMLISEYNRRHICAWRWMRLPSLSFEPQIASSHPCSTHERLSNITFKTSGFRALKLSDPQCTTVHVKYTVTSQHQDSRTRSLYWTLENVTRTRHKLEKKRKTEK